MTHDLSHLLSQLASLGQTELDAVHARVGFLRSIGSKTPRVSADTFEALVIDSIAAVLRDNGINWSLAQAKASGEYQKFAVKASTLEKFIISVTSQRNEQRALLTIGVELLFQHLTQRVNIPVGGKVLMRQVDRLPELFNASFPGYARAGMLRMVITTRREVSAEAYSQT